MIERDEAARLSQGCEHCGGTGLTTVFHRRYEGSGVIELTDRYGVDKRVPGRVGAYCVCPMGRWILGTHERHSPDLAKQIPDLATVFDGRSVWLAEDPTEANRAVP